MYEIKLKTASFLIEALEKLIGEAYIKPIAGGTDLLPLLHKVSHIEQLKAHPVFVNKKSNKIILVDLTNVEELYGVSKNNNHVEIGSCTTHTELDLDPLVNQYYPSLAEAGSRIGSPQIRNRGTVGGNIANASPAADTVPPLMALRAELEIASPYGIRKLPIEEFFLGPGENILKSIEIISKIIIPLPHPTTIQFYRRIAARKVHACAKASVAFCAVKEDNIFKNIRITFGAVGPTVISANETAKILEGENLTPSLINQAVKQAMEETNPIDDIRSTGEYRKAMIGELLRQELEKLLKQ